MKKEHLEKKPAFLLLMNLASEKLGAKTLQCSDDFFASMHNLIKSGRGVFIEGKYTEQGKWMDGWESRRKRTLGYDWCIIQLGAPGIIEGVDVDTNHFLGNHPPHCSIDACLDFDPEIPNQVWTEILSKVELDPGSQHFYDIQDTSKWSHLRLNIYPDGGVARLKVYGTVTPAWSTISSSELINLASAKMGAKAVLCNDMFFSHMDNLLMPARGKDMGDGWETKRNRTPNNSDWVIIRLGHPGQIVKAVVDTCHFKGNYPDSFSLEGTYTVDDKLKNADWKTIILQTQLGADKEHVYETDILEHEGITHVKLNIFPDGGVSRLRLWGHKQGEI